MARGVTLAGPTPGLEARSLANRSDEGLGRPGPVDKSEGFGWARLAQGPSIKVRDSVGRAVPGPVDKSEGFWGRAGPGPVDKWHACPGSYNKFIHFATNGTHAQPRRIGNIKAECVGRAMLGVEVIALGDGTLVDR